MDEDLQRNGGHTNADSNAGLIEQLRAREAFYKSIIEGAADVTSLVEPDGKILYISASVADKQTSLGYDPKELIGQNTLFLIHPDDRPAVVQAMINDLAGKPTTVEARAHRPDGSWIWVEMRGKAIVGPDGKPIVVAYSRNIDDRKRLQERLKASQEYYSALLHGSSDVIVVTNRSGTLNFASDSARAILGYQPKEVVGQNMLSFVHGEDQSLVAERLAAATEEPSPLLEVRLRRKDGSWCTCEGTGRVVDSPEGEQLVVINIRDVSERKRLDREHALLAAIVESSDDAIVSNSLDFQITTWNRGAERLFGFTAAEAIGQPASLYMPPEKREWGKAFLEELKNHIDQVQSFEVPCLCKDGRVIDVWTVCGPIRDRYGKLVGISAIHRDLTERKRAEREQALLAALVRSSEDAIISYSTDFRITSWNRGAQRLLGYAAEEALGARPFDLYVPPDDRAADRMRLQRDLAMIREDPEAMRQFEMPVLTKGGAILDVVVVGCGIHDSNGTLLGLSTIMHDVTQRKRAEREQALLAALVKSSEDAIISYTTDFRITSWNLGAQRLLGYTAEEALGKRPFDLVIRPSDSALAREQMQYDLAAMAASPERRRLIEITLRTKDGELVDAMIVANGIHDSTGKLIGFSTIMHDVTERRRIEREKAALAAIVESSDDAILSVGLKFDIIYWNRGAEKMFGFTADEAIGKPITLHVPPEDHARATEITSFVIKHPDEVVRFEAPSLRKDGVRLQVSTVCFAIRDREGKVVAVSAILRDVTERNRVERENASLAAIVESSDDAISSVGLDRRITYWNRGAEKLLGYTSAEAIGQPITICVPPDHRTHLQAVLDQLISHPDQVVRFETPNLRKDGTLVEASTVCVAIPDREGRTIGISAIQRDITERKRAGRQAALLAAIVNASQDTIINVSPDLGILSWNPAAAAAYGYRDTEAIGKSIELFVPPEELQETIARAAHVVETGRPVSWEHHPRSRDGRKFVFAVSVFPIRDESGKIISLGGIGRDITALKETQRQLLEAREAALAASRAKSEFLASMSHEIRTPMTAILGMAELLGEGELNAEQRRYIEILDNNGHALLDLINSILDLAKIESGRLTLEHIAFDLPEVALKAAQTLAIRAHAKGLELIVDIAPDVPAAVLGDPLRLRQVLINLLGNAIKFTERGEVLLAVKRDSAEGEPLRLKFSVCDTGIGIAKDKLPLLFEAFSQADSSTARKYGGSGLGLAIVKRLVDLMQGEVTLESELGKGSTFSFTSPFELDPNSTVGAPSWPDLTQVPVLLVVGNKTERKVLRRTLNVRSADVAEVASHEEGSIAIARAVANGRPPRLVLLDTRIGSPNVSAMEQLIAGASQCGASIVALVHCDNLAADTARLKSLKLDYLIKPIDMRELARVIRHVIVGGDTVTAPETRRPVSAGAATLTIVDRPLKILFADDSIDNRTLIRTFLKKTPYHLDEVENGRQAIDGFIAAGDYDLVLMDIQMPEVDGYAATRAIRDWEREHNRPHTPIIALTASVFPEAIRQAKDAGCDGHLGKPISKRALLGAIYDAVTSGAAA